MTGRNKTNETRATASSIHKALRQYTQAAAHPFAITRGADHSLVYANSAFCLLAGVPNAAVIGAPIATRFNGAQRPALIALLDRALNEHVELVDQVIDASGVEAGGSWRCSVWPVIAPSGNVEALGLEIR